MGNVVVKYTYSALGWCNVTFVAEGVKELSTLNPFRFRSYYYDTETSLYFLKTRYYDPAVGRFINMDDTSYLAPDTINGLNLYAYCGNNPIMYYDPTGCSLIGIGLFLLATAIIGGVIGANVAINNSKEDDESNIDSGQVAKGALLGVAMGFAAGGAILATGGVIAGAIAGPTVTIAGTTALQMFATGALAFDLVAFTVAPLAGFEMEAIEYETPPTRPQPVFKPRYN